jgi:hypothetical protein
MSNKIYVVMTHDRHTDTAVEVFSKKQDAINYAWDSAKANCRAEDVDHPKYGVRQHKKHVPGYVLILYYGTEGDCVEVVKRYLDGA